MSLLTSFKNSIELIIGDVTRRKNFSLQEIAQLNGEMITALNTGMDGAINLTIKNLQNIEDEYSQKRERGQRD